MSISVVFPLINQQNPIMHWAVNEEVDVRCRRILNENSSLTERTSMLFWTG